MSRPFGWDLPPGCTTAMLDAAAGIEGDPTPEEDAVYELLAEYNVPQQGIDKVLEKVREVVWDRARAKELLCAAVGHLPARTPAPACTCGVADTDPYWCELHNSNWSEPTLKEEIETYLKENGK